MRHLTKLIIPFFLILFIIGLIAYAKMEVILSYALTKEFKTSVKIENVTVSPMKDLHIENIIVSNPYNYPSPYALQIGLVSIHAPFDNYIAKVVYIDKIELTNIILTVDHQNNITNWEALMQNLDSDNIKSESYAIIKKLTFNNLTIRIETKDGSFKTQTIPKLTLHDIKTKEGELTKRLTQAILKEVIFNIKNLINIPLKMSQDAINKPVDTTLDGIKALNPFSK